MSARAAADPPRKRRNGRTAPRQASGRLRASELVRRLEERIGCGVLPPGTWLKQVDLQRDFGCSRIYLREALNRLMEKGLVSLEVNRGYRVREMDETRLLEILHVRAVLEAEAIGEIATEAEQADLDELRRLAAEFSEAVLHGTVVEQEQANRRFHAALLRPCVNQELVSLIFDLRNRTPVFQNRRKNTHARLLESAAEHTEMLALLEARDATALRELTRRHVLGGTEGLQHHPESRHTVARSGRE